MGELAKIESFCELNKTNLTFKRDVSKDEWMYVFKALKQIEGCIQFWIGDCLAYRQQKWGMYNDIAEETGYDIKALRNIKNIADKVESSRRRDDLSFSHHAEVASLPPEKQELFLRRAIDEKLSVRELREEIRKDNYVLNPVKFPDGKYRVIYADPPWKYKDGCESGSIQSLPVESHYPTMTIQEICDLPVNKISDENAILFLWVTSPLLKEGFEVIESWGFKYKSLFIWDKIKHNLGHYNSVRQELLLICTKGSCLPDKFIQFDSVQSIERTEHSVKPEEFRKIIDTLYTHGRKIELFARKKADGWESFGNEL